MQIKETLQKVNVVFKDVTMLLMHHIYNRELYSVESTHLEVDYLTFYDHMKFATRFRDASFKDLTGYPFTVNPSKELKKS